MAQYTAPDPRNCLLGKGKLLVDRFTRTGDRTGYLYLGNVSSLNTRPNDNRRQLADYQDHSAGTYAEALANRDVEMSFTITEFNQANLALLTAGTSGYYTQASTAVTGETLTSSLVLGASYFTAKRQIASVVVKQGMTTLDLTDDYTVSDANAGQIYFPTTSGATEGSAVTIDYTPAAITTTAQPKVDLYAEGTITGSVIFLPDPTAGPGWEVRWYNVSFRPGDLNSLIGDDFASSEVTGNVLNDRRGAYGGSETSPYGVAYAR